MTPTARMFCGDCVDVMKSLDAASVDSIVTDPPAGIGFMGKAWDSDKGGRDQWIAWMQSVAVECLRVLKPGGHALVWALPRTSHWTATAWENAGFDVRDRVAHLHGAGFPKSLDVSKAIDKEAGVGREVTRAGVVQRDGYGDDWDTGSSSTRPRFDNPSTDAARQWQGWGTALKPAVEDWWLLRKPLTKGHTVAANVLAFGTGALNIDASRVGNTVESWPASRSYAPGQLQPGGNGGNGKTQRTGEVPPGRWPANLCHDDSPEALSVFPQATASKSGGVAGWQKGGYVGGKYEQIDRTGYDDTGSAARFFWSPKASSRDRNDGTYDLPDVPTQSTGWSGESMPLRQDGSARKMPMRGNHHPTVKATALMRYLCRLITPPNGTLLDPFMGSGSTLKAAEIEGFSSIGIDIDPAYVEIARRRFASDMPLFRTEAA